MRAVARRARGPVVAAAAGLALALAAGCATGTISLAPAPRAFTGRDYTRVYDAWTRSSEAYSIARFADILHATATFESWEFRWAYVVRYAADYAIAPAARDEMLRAALADAAVTHRFFVTMAGGRIRETDLTSPESAWRVLLVAPDGSTEPPSELRKVVRPGAVERLYFPSVSPYRQVFRVGFPAVRADGTRTIPEGSDRVVLRFAGALGTVDLEWRLEP